MYILLTSAAMAQLDFRITAAYGAMDLIPQTSLNLNTEAENYVTAGFQADYYLTDHFGIGVGADYYITNGNYNVVLSDYEHSYQSSDNWAVDPYPRDYEFIIRSNTPDIIEQNTISLVDIPVSFIHTFPLFNNVFLATRVGAKMGIPFNDTYRLDESDLYSRLYFEEWDLELFEIPAHGLYDSRTDWHPEGELKLRKAYSFFSEIGLDFPVSPLKVRISGYFSYGLNSIINENESSLIYWREDYNHILSLTESTKIMQYGIKLGIGLMSYKEKKVKYKNRNVCDWETAFLKE